MSKRDKEDKYDSREESHSDESRSRSTSRNNRKGKHSSRSPDKQDHDSLSIYIGNVDYSATEDELRDTFLDCGDIVRVTIIKNMKTGHPKGAAFIEFTDKEGVNTAMQMNGKQVKGRPLIVTSKKPRPEYRERSDRDRERGSGYHDRYAYERRGPPRSAPLYPAYPSGRVPYGGPAPRGYYPDPRDIYDSRRPSHMPPMEPPHMQPRYDPYRRPEFYDPYMMMPRGMQGSHYYPGEPKRMSDLRGDPRGDPRYDPRMDPRYRDPRDSRSDPRSDSRSYPRGEPRENGREPRENGREPRGESRGDSRNHHRAEQSYSSRR